MDYNTRFVHLMKNGAMRNYIASTANGESYWLIPTADGLIARIEEVIAMIEKEIGGR